MWRRDDFLSIIGPSGSGKSTLFHVIGGLTPPTTGKVVVGDKDLSAMTDAERTRMRKRTVGFVFQKFNLLPNLTARDNIAVARYIGGSDSKPEADFEEVLRLLGIGERLDHKPNALSGGEQQRVAIARAIVNHPAISTGRRAYRKSGHGELKSRVGSAARPEPAVGPNDPNDHPQSGGGGLRRFHSPHARRPDHEPDVSGLKNRATPVGQVPGCGPSTTAGGSGAPDRAW